MSKTLVITGSTGFLGPYLSREILKGDNNLIFVGRSKNGKTLKDRVISDIGLTNLNKVNFIEADFAVDSNSLLDSLKKITNNIDGIWHLAADLSFKEKNRERVRKININSTKAIIEIAKDFNCTLYYVSTAYVHGSVSGLAYENFNLRPNKFNNIYEESKFDTELIIKNESNLNWVIFRPSILIDKEIEKFSNFGYYSFLVSLLQLRRSFNLSRNSKLFLPLPLFYARDSYLNLMPVNIAADWMNRIALTSKCTGKIFHICNPMPFLIKNILEQTLRASLVIIPIVGVTKWLASFYISLVTPLSIIFTPVRPVARRLRYFKGYMLEHVYYDMKNVKEILNIDLESSFDFPDDYIFRIASSFKNKFDK